MSGPLKGIMVVELGNAIASPLCCSLLGDMGAGVVKVEAPGRGDDARGWGYKVKGESPYFIQYNRNKRSIALDVKRREGRAVLSKLLKRADVLVENFRPGTLARLGFPRSRLRRINPGLVLCSISGFGQTGPYKELGGYDSTVQALSGVMDVTGEEDGPPLRVGVPITDIVAALYAAFSVVAALLSRSESKKGQAIDVSLFESGVSSVAQWITLGFLTGKRFKRFGNEYPLLAPYELFDSSDRPFVLAIGNEQQWSKLCRLIGRPDLIQDPRFRTNLDRIAPENRTALNQVLEKIFAGKPADDWLKAFGRAGIPAGKISKIEELPSDPQLKSRHTFARVKHRRLGETMVVAALPKLSATPASVRSGAPELGEHTSQILRELGYSKAQISAMKRDGIV